MGDFYISQENKRDQEERLRREREERQKNVDDIDGDINWAYSEMRRIEAWLEQRLENTSSLSSKEEKRIDKSIVVMRTGLKMLKKVVKARCPQIDTRAWKDQDAIRQ